MADATKKVIVSETSHSDDDLPPPPPPPVPPRPLDYEGSPPLASLPVPPPKETFSTFYQQQQKNEIKRLFKHIHPELRDNLNDMVDDELVEALHSDAAEAADAGYQAEVQSMRWIFENWTLDNIGDPHTTRKLLDEEELRGGDVRGTSSVFQQVDGTQRGAFARRQTSVRGDVRTSTWLFETQPMDALNKLKTEEGELVETVLKEPVERGDVRGARLLFESQTLTDLGRCSSIEDYSFLKLKSELQEQKGGIQKTVKLFEADPCCAIKDNSGNMHEVRSICREEIKTGSTSTARWLFETQPLGTINKGTDGVKMIRGISLEEGQRGGVDSKRWMFETQPLGMIQEGKEKMGAFEGAVENRGEAMLKGDSAEGNLAKEQVLGGDVKTSLWLFETQPMDSLSESLEVGRLQKITLSADEQGAVKGTKQMFENYSTATSTLVKEQKIEKGDVKSFKNLFETIPISNITRSDVKSDSREINITAGNVKGNKALFETTPLYTIKDSSGNLHEVTTVSREELIKGNVQNYKWLFNTKPLDQFTEGKENVEVIKGITREVDTADVNMAKWLFETQTIDGIHSKFNQTEAKSSTKEEQLQKGDVKTCRWLFETQPMDILYDKSETVKDKDALENTNVKSFTWLFESQPLASVKDSEEQRLKCVMAQDSVKAEVGVETVKRLFETETLDRIRKDTNVEGDARYVSQVDVQSGDVSRVKELFESRSLDEIGSEMVTTSDTQDLAEHIPEGSVHKFTWMFENRPINMINEKDKALANTQKISEVEGGDVTNKKFVFETFSLDKIHDQPFEEKSACFEKPESNVDVKSSTMIFESQPLYAIRDKEGQFHEVTTVKKEEIVSSDVRGARWMFETKPLDAIKADNEIYVIRAVTQEDVKKGDVKSARWKFETQPLDSFTSPDTPAVLDVEDIVRKNVQLNKQIFESDQAAHKNFVRMVSVTDVQQGDVRTSTWLFENHKIDSLKGDSEEQGTVNTVQREDKGKGDVKRSTFLFESQPLDKIKEANDTLVPSIEQDRPKADVKSTTWLFETTPLDKITTNSVAETLTRLHELTYLHSSGIIIEASEVKNVTMAKYQLEEGVQIQNEEVIEGNIRNIMLQLLCKPTLKPQITIIREMEKGDLNTTVVELPVNQTTAAATNPEEDQRVVIAQMIESLLIHTKSLKKGIIMQECAGGHAEMTVYSLVHHCQTKTESEDIEWRGIKSTIGDLMATSSSQRTATSCRIDENEKGNVNLYKSCIERGDLQYLKSLQTELLEEDQCQSPSSRERIEILRGDIKEAQRSLYQQKDLVERTICDVLPGDVKNVKKVFTSDCAYDVDIPKEEIIPGDIATAKQQLSAKQSMMMEKEEVVAGDIKATMQSLERAKQQSMHVEREAIKPGTIYDMDLSTQGPDMEEGQTQKEEIVSGDVRAAKRSLEMAKSQSMHMERETVVPGKIYNVKVSAQEQSSSTVTETHSSSSGQQIRTTFQKVSEAMKSQKSHDAFPSSEKDEVSKSAVRANCCAKDSLSLPVEQCEVQTSEEEAEVFKGDVKATIRSLQSAAMEHKLPEKEDIVRGNMQFALQSLERSRVNVSKGDYKTAMIYRNSSRGCSGNGPIVKKQGVVVSMPPSDTELLSPSISVTFEEQPSVSRQNTTIPKPVTIQNGNPSSYHCEDKTTPQLPQKAHEKPHGQKPTLAPKPEWTKSAQSKQPQPRLEASYLSGEQSPVIPLNTKHSVQTPTVSPNNPQRTRRHGIIFPNREVAQDTFIPKSFDDTTESFVETQANVTEPTKGTLSQTDTESLSSGMAETKIDKNVVRKINAAEEIQKSIKSYSEGDRDEISMGFQTALQNFGRREKQNDVSASILSKNVKVVNDIVVQERQAKQSTAAKKKSIVNVSSDQCNNQLQEEAVNFPTDTYAVQPNALNGEEQKRPEERVVFRKKKAKETEDQRRQRLSVHKDEIMTGNVKAAMGIFENLRKREELKIILSQVQEMEGDTSDVDVGSMKMLFEDVPAWIATPSRTARKKNRKEEKKVEMDVFDDDLESTSSVETAFEDLEKASKDIMDLKEQTLAKLLDIEEAIKKALYSVSSLKSEADIAGLSGLFDESLKSEQSFQPSNNIRKISIVSSKAKPQLNKETGEVSEKNKDASPSKQTDGTSNQARRKPLIRQSSAPSCPSFISIHSAARKNAEQPKSPMSTFKPKTEGNSNGDLSQTSIHFQSPATPRRKVSVLEVKTVPEPAVGIIGTKTVSETYEETDGFGNSFVSSKTSTVVTKQSNSKASALFDVVGSPSRYEVMTPPIMQRRTFSESGLNNTKEEGTVFVTFSQPTAKH
ncbi:xin actin-binding repeat-containing protein 1 isoform X2 [Gadus morhua]|nr:xin actin-binding repeat-containing protein 1-like isoform X2 [Gadus morhua]XP_030219088.1 xin actin-binding repeat-containing protein 1-like isoform X2 [Gadus morhua]